MRILIACGKDTYPNPFVGTLADGLSKIGVSVVCSIDDFWNNWQQYDAIHIQWPQVLTRGIHHIDVLRCHLIEIKDAGIPLVITCHNFHPHYSNETISNEAYDVAYNYADCIIHLGSYSYEVFKEEYPEAKHVVIPHHIYDGMYKKIPTREEALEHLRLNPNKEYVLCFGAFRDKEERDLANIVAINMGNQGVELLAPGFSRVTLQKNLWMVFKNCWHYIINKIKYSKVHFSSSFVPDDELPYYYAVCDIALIQRKKILNSGNLPMAFMMGKVVVGPDVGNVGSILKETGNPMFNVNNPYSTIDAVNEAMKLSDKGKGEDNKKYAYDNWATTTIAQHHYQLYHDLTGCNG